MSKLPSLMWMGLIQSVEGPKRKKTEVPSVRGNSASQLPSDSSCNIDSSLGLPPADIPKDFGLANPQNDESQLLHSLSLSMCMYTHTLTHIHPIASASLENPD